MRIEREIETLIETLRIFATSQSSVLVKATSLCENALSGGGKILICGNGGSAADSQHFAAELVVRFKKNRRPLPAIALTTDTSILTAGANDFGYETVFARQVQALGKEGDVLIGISTSGRSKNVILALTEAKRMGLKTIGLCGKDPKDMADLCDVCITVPSEKTSHIQEVHEVCLHIIAEELENYFLQEEGNDGQG